MVIAENNDAKTAFSNVRAAELFEKQGEYYIKLNSNIELANGLSCNAVNLTDGVLCYVGKDARVRDFSNCFLDVKRG